MGTRLIQRWIVLGALMIAGTTDIRAQTPAERPSAGAQSMMKGMSENEFVPMMIKHHQDGIEMAQLEEQQGSSAEVKALAAKIRRSQQRELADLKEHAQHATAGTKGTTGHESHGTMEGHDKMMERQSQATMKRLRSASGAALDHAFVEEMAKHHQMAISMTESAKIESPELKQLAEKMVEGQRQELSELKRLQASHR